MLMGLGLLLAASLVFCVSDAKASVIIESQESLNSEMKPVYNEIQFFPGWDQDVWMMNQSHFGPKPSAHQWERLAIVIDKKKSPKTVRFYQLEPGKLEWSEDLLEKRVLNRASCFTCHNNGPKALRPVYESTNAPLTWTDRLKIQAWNFRIKTYGRIAYDPKHSEEDAHLKVPFRYVKERYNDKLTVKTCTVCHKESGFMARGALERQQTSTIEFMVDNGYMPPPGFKLSEKEKEQLVNFLRGF